MGSGGKRVVIRSRRSGRRVTVTVTDNGPGLADGEADKIFAAFHSGRREGCGIGLYTCREILSSLGGTITAGNLDAGGARFTVALPAADAVHGEAP